MNPCGSRGALVELLQNPQGRWGDPFEIQSSYVVLTLLYFKVSYLKAPSVNFSLVAVVVVDVVVVIALVSERHI